MSKKPNLPTEIIAIIDRSGSMEMIREDAICAFNSFFQAQKNEEGDANLSLVLFDNEYTPLFWHCPIEKADSLNEKSYLPRGTTAMLDAIGRTLNILRAKWAGQVPRNVVVAILTDGHENASQEYSWDAISKLVADCRDRLGWEFVFLAADQDAVLTASHISIPSQDAQSFSRTSQGISEAAHFMSFRVSEKRASFKK